MSGGGLGMAAAAAEHVRQQAHEASRRITSAHSSRRTSLSPEFADGQPRRRDQRNIQIWRLATSPLEGKVGHQLTDLPPDHHFQAPASIRSEWSQEWLVNLVNPM
jgi:hypothetical protein